MRGAVLEELLNLAEALLDPLRRRGPKDLVAAAGQAVNLVAECLDAPLGFDQGLRERLAAAALADEVEEVREPALLRRELRLLQASACQGGQSGSLAISSSTRLQDVRDVLGVGDPRP